MGYIQGANRNQVMLLPDTLEDCVGGDNEVRAIDAFIDSLDISLMGFKADPAKEGRLGFPLHCGLPKRKCRINQGSVQGICEAAQQGRAALA